MRFRTLITVAYRAVLQSPGSVMSYVTSACRSGRLQDPRLDHGASLF